MVALKRRRFLTTYNVQCTALVHCFDLNPAKKERAKLENENKKNLLLRISYRDSQLIDLQSL